MKLLKYTFFLSISLLFAVQAIAQPNTRRMNISIGVFSPSATSYDYEGAIGVVGSTGYDVDDIVAGEDMFWDDRSRYRVDSVEIIVAGTSATVWVTDLYTAGAPQSGKGTLGKPSPKTGVQPLTENGSNFITEAQEAKIMTDNLNRLDSLGGDGNGIISALPAGHVSIEGGTNSLTLATGGYSQSVDGTYRVSGDNDDDFQIYFRGPFGLAPSLSRKFKVGDVEFENNGTRISVDDETGIILLDAAEFGVAVNNEGSNKYVAIGDYDLEQDETVLKVDDAAGEISMSYSTGTYVLPNTMPTANQVLGEGATDDNILEWVNPPVADGNLGTQDVTIPAGTTRTINFGSETSRLRIFEQGINRTAFEFKTDSDSDEDERTWFKGIGPQGVSELYTAFHASTPLILGRPSAGVGKFQIQSSRKLGLHSGLSVYSVDDVFSILDDESMFSFVMGDNLASSTIFHDNTTTKTGIQYAADYSASFTNRSLADKGYVDAQVALAGDGNGIYSGSDTVGTATTVTLNNNLTFNDNGGYVKMGGLSFSENGIGGEFAGWGPAAFKFQWLPNDRQFFVGDGDEDGNDMHLEVHDIERKAALGEQYGQASIQIDGATDVILIGQTVNEPPLGFLIGFDDGNDVVTLGDVGDVTNGTLAVIDDGNSSIEMKTANFTAGDILGNGNSLTLDVDDATQTVKVDNNGTAIASFAPGASVVTATGAATGKVVVSGASSLPSSISHIQGLDTTQVNVRAAGGIGLKATRLIDFQTDTVLFNGLIVSKSSPIGGILGMKNYDGRWDIQQDGKQGNLNLYAYNLTPSDPYGLRIEHDATTRLMTIGDYAGDFSGGRAIIDDFNRLMSYGFFGEFGLEVNKTTDVISLGDFDFQDNGSLIELDDDAMTITIEHQDEPYGLLLNNRRTLDFNFIRLGDIKAWRNGLLLDIRNNEDDVATAKLGDVDGISDGTLITVDEVANTVRLNANSGTTVSGAAYTYTLPVTTPTAADSLRRVMTWKEGEVGTFQVFNGANYRTAIVDGNILPYDDYVEVDPNVTVSLPAPIAGLAGKVFHIIAGGGTGGANPGTIDVVDNSSTIETGTSLTLISAFESYSLVCNGSQWIVLNNKP